MVEGKANGPRSLSDSRNDAGTTTRSPTMGATGEPVTTVGISVESPHTIHFRRSGIASAAPTAPVHTIRPNLTEIGFDAQT